MNISSPHLLSPSAGDRMLKSPTPTDIQDTNSSHSDQVISSSTQRDATINSATSNHDDNNHRFHDTQRKSLKTEYKSNFTPFDQYVYNEVTDSFVKQKHATPDNNLLMESAISSGQTAVSSSQMSSSSRRPELSHSTVSPTLEISVFEPACGSEHAYDVTKEPWYKEVLRRNEKAHEYRFKSEVGHNSPLLREAAASEEALIIRRSPVSGETDAAHKTASPSPAPNDELSSKRSYKFTPQDYKRDHLIATMADNNNFKLPKKSDASYRNSPALRGALPGVSSAKSSSTARPMSRTPAQARAKSQTARRPISTASSEARTKPATKSNQTTPVKTATPRPSTAARQPMALPKSTATRPATAGKVSIANGANPATRQAAASKRPVTSSSISVRATTSAASARASTNASSRNLPATGVSPARSTTARTAALSVTRSSVRNTGAPAGASRVMPSLAQATNRSPLTRTAATSQSSSRAAINSARVPSSTFKGSSGPAASNGSTAVKSIKTKALVNAGDKAAALASTTAAAVVAAGSILSTEDPKLSKEDATMMRLDDTNLAAPNQDAAMQNSTLGASLDSNIQSSSAAVVNSYFDQEPNLLFATSETGNMLADEIAQAEREANEHLERVSQEKFDIVEDLSKAAEKPAYGVSQESTAQILPPEKVARESNLDVGHRRVSEIQVAHGEHAELINGLTGEITSAEDRYDSSDRELSTDYGAQQETSLSQSNNDEEPYSIMVTTHDTMQQQDPMKSIVVHDDGAGNSESCDNAQLVECQRIVASLKEDQTDSRPPSHDEREPDEHIGSESKKDDHETLRSSPGSLNDTSSNNEDGGDEEIIQDHPLEDQVGDNFELIPSTAPEQRGIDADLEPFEGQSIKEQHESTADDQANFDDEYVILEAEKDDLTGSANLTKNAVDGLEKTAHQMFSSSVVDLESNLDGENSTENIKRDHSDESLGDLIKRETHEQAFGTAINSLQEARSTYLLDETEDADLGAKVTPPGQDSESSEVKGQQEETGASRAGVKTSEWDHDVSCREPANVSNEEPLVSENESLEEGNGQTELLMNVADLVDAESKRKEEMMRKSELARQQSNSHSSLTLVAHPSEILLSADQLSERLNVASESDAISHTKHDDNAQDTVTTDKASQDYDDSRTEKTKIFVDNAENEARHSDDSVDSNIRGNLDADLVDLESTSSNQVELDKENVDNLPVQAKNNSQPDKSRDSDSQRTVEVSVIGEHDSVGPQTIQELDLFSSQEDNIQQASRLTYRMESIEGGQAEEPKQVEATKGDTCIDSDDGEQLKLSNHLTNSDDDIILEPRNTKSTIMADDFSPQKMVTGSRYNEGAGLGLVAQDEHLDGLETAELADGSSAAIETPTVAENRIELSTSKSIISEISPVGAFIHPGSRFVPSGNFDNDDDDEDPSLNPNADPIDLAATISPSSSVAEEMLRLSRQASNASIAGITSKLIEELSTTKAYADEFNGLTTQKHPGMGVSDCARVEEDRSESSGPDADRSDMMPPGDMAAGEPREYGSEEREAGIEAFRTVDSSSATRSNVEQLIESNIAISDNYRAPAKESVSDSTETSDASLRATSDVNLEGQDKGSGEEQRAEVMSVAAAAASAD